MSVLACVCSYLEVAVISLNITLVFTLGSELT